MLWGRGSHGEDDVVPSAHHATVEKGIYNQPNVAVLLLGQINRD